MMKITGLSHLFRWENLHNWWLTKYFFAPLYTILFNKWCSYCLMFKSMLNDRNSACQRLSIFKNNRRIEESKI